ncbi:CehA/McbA family metallohydrolase [Paenibacillus sp. F411]|uniref:CehA/McbA family metallohydrolase n=1 Tax=unclassified Paenibacillus TaxID=185978 RepID=UPI001AAF1B4B|nr:CehA/McbA family metallohydrolase [Paenibacillus sp. F411]
MIWVPFELHTHTPHSDGRHSLAEMCREAGRLGLQGIALTDHNTAAGLAEAEHIQQTTGVAVIPGMEWTTFYGHMLTLGAPYTEWRDLGPRDIHKGIRRVHEAGGIVGIAHPYTMGSPICTGCHWEYDITDWSDLDYIEVWHGMMPALRPYNRPALQLWDQLLNEGHRITATAGRDWHHSDLLGGAPAFTYIGLEHEEDRFSREKVVQAISHGRCYLSVGPRLHVEARLGGRAYFLGDCVDSSSNIGGEMSLRLQLDSSTASGNLGERVVVTKLILESNLGEITEIPWREDQSEAEHLVSIEGLRWLRVKAEGLMESSPIPLAMTNPIYVSSPPVPEPERAAV